jgi:lysophospholipase L1-like esterase
MARLENTMKSTLALFTTLLSGILALIVTAQLSATPVTAAEPVCKRGDFVAMGGDSITYMSRYSVFVEMYLLAARPDLNLRVMKIQRGCGGSADGYVRDTLEQELIPAKPNVFTICFGMNDGGGAPTSDEVAQRYEKALTQVVERNRANGTITVVCSPGVVDEFSYENVTLAAAAFNAANGNLATADTAAKNAPAVVYNRTLADLRDIGRRVAESHNMPFANIHDAMEQVMQAAKAAYGTTWPARVSLRRPERRAILCDDGIHPDLAAHIPMAYAVLKAMRFDGEIGSITLDWAKGTAEADASQKATVTSRGTIDVESTRIPLSFFDDSAASEGYPSVPCRYVLQHCPFNNELNRYILKVKGLPNQPIRVTWGNRELFFTREQMEAGINLASEFAENPFCPLMRELDAAIWKKQDFERTLFKVLNVAVWKATYGNRTPEWRRENLQKNFDEISTWLSKECPNNHELINACAILREHALAKDEDLPAAEFTKARELLFARQKEYHLRAREILKTVHHTIRVKPCP